MKTLTALKVSLLTGLLVLGLAGSAAAEPVVVVQNGNDSGAGSLRQALQDVDTGGKVVIPASVGTITLGGEALKIGKSVTIEGAGSGQTAISAAGKSRVIWIEGSPTVTIEGVQITGGKIEEIGKENYGAGILQTGGTLTVENSLIVGNQMEMGPNGFPRGAGIGVKKGSVSLTLRGTVVSDNYQHGQQGKGAGIEVEGAALTIEGGAVKGNTNEAMTGFGGGINFQGTRMSLSHLTVSGNEQKSSGAAGYAYGGGIADVEGTAALIDGVTVAHNTERFGDDKEENPKVYGAGVAINDAGATIVNSTIAENIGVASAKAGAQVVGGGLYINAPLSIVSSTIARNSVGVSGAAAIATGGNLAATEPNTRVSIRDSIITRGAAEGGEPECNESVAGLIVSQGGNVGGEECQFSPGSDTVNALAELGPLADNGGPVQTMALLPGSGAIDAANACPTTDARGVLRPAGAACDAGAFEVATPSVATGAADGVGTVGATLSGSATNPDLVGGTVSFQYGTATGYSSQTAAQPIAPTTRGADFSATIGELAPNTTYHYRAVVTNALGTVTGPDLIFTTARSPEGKGGPGGGGGGGGPKGKLTMRHLKGLRVQVVCSSGPCNGSLVATARAGKKTIVVAKAKLRLPAGTKKAVTLKKTPKGKDLLALPGKLPVVLKAKLGQSAAAPKPLRFKLG